MSLTWYEHGPKLKKWFVHEDSAEDHESQSLPASEILWRGDDSRTWIVEPHLCIINIPYKEFRELAFMLPEFNELPILWAAWCQHDRPVEFLVRCIEDEDVLLIDTSGYHHARYRAACRLRESLV
jgi:hypothetical protein